MNLSHYQRAKLLQQENARLRTMLGQERDRIDQLTDVLEQHVKHTIRFHDAWAAEGNECTPCKCPGCRTYRAALWVLNMPDSGQRNTLDSDDESEDGDD